MYRNSRSFGLGNPPYPYFENFQIALPRKNVFSRQVHPYHLYYLSTLYHIPTTTAVSILLVYYIYTIFHGNLYFYLSLLLLLKREVEIV